MRIKFDKIKDLAYIFYWDLRVLKLVKTTTTTDIKYLRIRALIENMVAMEASRHATIN